MPMTGYDIRMNSSNKMRRTERDEEKRTAVSGSGSLASERLWASAQHVTRGRGLAAARANLKKSWETSGLISATDDLKLL